MKTIAYLYLLAGSLVLLGVAFFCFIVESHALDHDGAQLPVSIPQSVYDKVAKAEKFNKHWGAVTHWTSCGHTIDVSNAEIARLKQSCAVPSGCTKTEDFSDGPNGALWKPVSDTTGFPVFLLSAGYAGAVNDITVVDASGKELTTGFLRSCCANGDRAHFQLRKKASELPRDITVRLELTDGSTECRTVSDPNQRVD